MVNRKSSLNQSEEESSERDFLTDENEDTSSSLLEDLKDFIQPKSQETRPLQFRIPLDIFADFSECAGREFGFTHGAKKQLFLKIWERYKSENY